jgi:hypothetical protein
MQIRPEREGVAAPVAWSLAQAYVLPAEKVGPRPTGEMIHGEMLAECALPVS